jgi:hypothetical protein
MLDHGGSGFVDVSALRLLTHQIFLGRRHGHTRVVETRLASNPTSHTD